MRVLEDLYKIFKYILCGYSILKIKSIVMINILLSFIQNHSLKKSQIFSYIFLKKSLLEAFPFPPTQALKQNLRLCLGVLRGREGRVLKNMKY